jgi:ribosomal RNA-processing protein 36
LVLAEVKKLELVDKYNDMKGKDVDKYLQKKRKRNSAKERRNMPYRREVGGGEA